MSFTVVIPARNEEAGIATCICSVRRAAEQASKEFSTKADILVVDDFSSDATRSRAEASGARVLRHERRRGALAAWATGVRASDTPFVVFVDADSTVDDQAFIELLQAIDQPGVGVVSGRAAPVDDRFGGERTPPSTVVTRSSRFSAVLLDEIKSRVGDHDFIAIGRLMAIRREAWDIPNVELPHCDREVASSARRAGWRAVWVPQAKVFYHRPASLLGIAGASGRAKTITTRPDRHARKSDDLSEAELHR